MGGAFGTNDAFGKASGFLGMAKDSGIIAKTLFGGMQNILTNTASNAINAIELDKAGKLVWNDDSFLEGTLGKSAMASYASGMASSFTTGALDTQLRGFGGNTYTGGLRLDALAGSLVGQGVDYAMTGNATLNLANFDMFGFKDKHGKVISSGLLEMHIGDAGLSMNMGMGGADLSYGSIAGAMGGFKAWGVNAQLALSSQEEARKYRVAMRTLSSTGNASDSALYEELLAGKTNIEDDSSGNYSAHTTVANGQRTIHLGSDRSILTSDLSMGVLLSHEGYRNGLDDGEEGQLDETGRAIRGHVGTAAMLEATYGKGVLGGQMSEELAALASGDNGRIAQAFGRYDSSSDYWKMTKTGKLINDKHSGLLQEMADGTWVQVVKDDKESSVAAALVHYLGAGRANELLNRQEQKIFDWGTKSNQADTYDDQTLKDVLHLSESQIVEVRTDPKKWQSTLDSADTLQKEKLIGEALMKGHEIVANGNSWDGEGTGFSFSDNHFGDGTIGIRRLDDGSYEKFTVSAVAIRGGDAFKVLNKKNGKWEDKPEYNRNTLIGFIKTDLDGHLIGSPYNTGQQWNTVDNGHGQISGTYDQYYEHTFLGAIQANTVNADSYVHMFAATAAQQQKYGVSTLFMNTQSTTIDGRHIGLNATTADDQNPWLWHPAGIGTNDGCWTTTNSPGFVGNWKDAALIGSGANNFERVTDYLQNRWGVYNGLSIQTHLFNMNLYAGTGCGVRK